MSTPAAPGRLQPLLGPADAAALVVSTVIGVGIFTTPGIVAKMAPHPWAILGLWLAGGLLALAGAGAYAELAALHPHAGGEYVYLREGFGPLAGFLTGWTSFVAGFSGAIAAGAVGLASYLSRFWPPAGDTRALLRIPLYVGAVEISPQALTAALVVLVIAALIALSLNLLFLWGYSGAVRGRST